jgi:hypothetical protein
MILVSLEIFDDSVVKVNSKRIILCGFDFGSQISDVSV